MPEEENQTLSQDQDSDSSQKTSASSKVYPLSELMKNYLVEYKQGVVYERKPPVSPIDVDELASKLARLYEKVRRIIDWKEENLVRRTAIERILKRTLLSEISGLGTSSLDSDKITEPLVFEMIRSGYFSNRSVSKNKIPAAEESLAKYIYIINNSSISKSMHGLKVKEKINFFNWILEIAACEIEEILEPAFKQNALMNLMTTSIHQKLKIIPKDLISEEDVLLQTYIAVHRTLYGLDAPIIIYNLIKYRYPEWFEGDPDFIEKFSANIGQIKEQLEADLEHPYGKEFFKVCDQYDAAYLIIGDAMEELDEDLDLLEKKLKNKNTLMEAVANVYQARLKTLKQRLYRSAIYSTLSIFVAGIVSFIIFEGPVARLVGDGFSWFALFVDLAVPSALMFILVWTIRPPKADNLGRVKEEVQKIVYASDEEDVYQIQLNKKRSWLKQGIFGLISLIGGAIGTYAIYLVFKIAGVPWTSIYVDTVNVAMVISAALVIRHKAKEITIRERGSVVNMLVDLFSLPLAKLGQWISEKWKEYNIVSVFFTALVDTPFSVLITLIEEWRSFLQDQRSQIH